MLFRSGSLFYHFASAFDFFGRKIIHPLMKATFASGTVRLL
jgi:hypothetical protein